jgi:hypothetical protein
VDDPDNKLGTIALSWMAASRVADLRASGAPPGSGTGQFHASD